MTDSFVEHQTFHLLSGDTKYTSETSILYDDLPNKFSSYLINNLSYDDTYKIVPPTTTIFQFSVADNSGSTTAGRAIWIENTPVVTQINVIRAEVGNFVTFEYPGDNKSLYVKRGDEWKFIAPIVTNMIWLPIPMAEVKEIAVIDGTIETGTILLRRTFNENTVTA